MDELDWFCWKKLDTVTEHKKCKMEKHVKAMLIEKMQFVVDGRKTKRKYSWLCYMSIPNLQKSVREEKRDGWKLSRPKTFIQCKFMKLVLEINLEINQTFLSSTPTTEKEWWLSKNCNHVEQDPYRLCIPPLSPSSPSQDRSENDPTDHRQETRDNDYK